MYVWFDALSNYITALGYADGAQSYQRFWVEGGERLHLIGKEIAVWREGHFFPVSGPKCRKRVPE